MRRRRRAPRAAHAAFAVHACAAPDVGGAVGRYPGGMEAGTIPNITSLLRRARGAAGRTGGGARRRCARRTRQAARGHDATAAAAARGAFSAAFAPFEAVAEALARLGDDAAPEAVAEAQRRRRRSCDVAAAVTAMRL